MHLIKYQFNADRTISENLQGIVVVFQDVLHYSTLKLLIQKTILLLNATGRLISSTDIRKYMQLGFFGFHLIIYFLFYLFRFNFV